MFGAPVSSTGYALAVTDAPSFSVIMPVYNSRRYLTRTIPAVLEALEAYGRGEMIVVDNGSTDGSLRFVESEFGAQVRILEEPEATIAGARNAGVRASSGTVLSFVDSDCLVPRDYFRRAREVFGRTAADATGSWYRPAPDANALELTWYRLHAPPEQGPVESLNGGNLLVRKSAFEEVGGFSESLITGEDAELCQRLIDHEYLVYEAPEIEAVHLGNPDTVGDFSRQQVWHGLGMGGTVRLTDVDKPSVALAAHLLLVFVATPFLLLTPEQLLPGAVLSAVSLNAVPAVTVLYRWGRVRRISNPVVGLLLYHVYYAARSFALALITLGLERWWKRKNR